MSNYIVTKYEKDGIQSHYSRNIFNDVKLVAEP